MAAQQLFNREQLSAWDAGARSWLRTADQTKRLNQTQLMLIINNLSIPVNTSKEPYDSVISAWISGMTTMERLICGTPQRVQDGAILLAISSWHLYPNMHVLHESAKDINPGDELMARSMLTISSYGASHGREGVFWSLPLSRMRYYSPAIISERNLASDTSQISMKELQIVFLGAFIGRWRRVCSSETRCCALIISLYKAYRRFDREIVPWFKILAEAALRVTDSSGYLQAQYLKLLKLGSRRCQGFLHNPDDSPPAFFALEYFHGLIRALNRDEERVKLLRQAMTSRKTVGSNVIIRYKSGMNHHYASVFPQERTSRKRSAAQDETPSAGHQRFALGRIPESEVACSGPIPCGCMDTSYESCICKKQGARCRDLCHLDTPMCTSTDVPLPYDCQAGCQDTGTDPPCPACYNKLKIDELMQAGEEAILIHPGSTESIDEFQFQLERPGDRVMAAYELLLGHGNIAAVFQQKPEPTYDTYSRSLSDFPSATMEEIESAVASEYFDPLHLNLNSCCYHWDGVGFEQQMKSLNGFTFASDIYASMPDATVSIEVINQAMYSTSWASDSNPEYLANPNIAEGNMWWHRDEDDYITPPKSNINVGEITGFYPGSEFEHDNSINYICWGHRPVSAELPTAEHILRRAFSCIAWFESGEFDIPLSHCNAIMALVNGDSIYVASALLADPSVTEHIAPVQRVFGNIGRSEMCLLMPPADPRLSEPDLRSWKQVNHLEFDGRFESCFGSTTLHLTLTDSEDAVYMGNRGLRDRQVVIVEALVSIEDRGNNVGDLDILSMFSKPNFVAQKTCSHSAEQKASPTSLPLLASLLVSIDCWEEFLDPPVKTGIIRARGNWQARLGAAAAAIQMGKKVIVLPEEACLQCLKDSSIENDSMIIA